MLPPDWGLYSAVARTLNVSASFVSRVDRGLKSSARVTAALAEARRSGRGRVAGRADEAGKRDEWRPASR